MRLTSEQAFKASHDAIRRRAPFSAIRLGDGEGRVMGSPDAVSAFHLAQIWEIWFGHSLVTEYQLQFVQRELQRACRKADIVGLPIGMPNRHTDFGRVEVFFEERGYRSAKTQIADSGFHLDWQAEGLYKVLLEDVGSVGVVGSRDVRAALAAEFNIHDVRWAVTPTEMRFSQMSEGEKLQEILFRPHLFTRFNEIMTYGIPSTLDGRPGGLVLVGAGVLGKIYAQRVKELGGVAIDVGSMMDLWAGLKTRNMPQFDGMVDLT